MENMTNNGKRLVNRSSGDDWCSGIFEGCRRATFGSRDRDIALIDPIDRAPLVRICEYGSLPRARDGSLLRLHVRWDLRDPLLEAAGDQEVFGQPAPTSGSPVSQQGDQQILFRRHPDAKVVRGSVLQILPHA